MDSALKQRLLGAVVLIALAIIFVPMFFSGSGPKQESATVNLEIPPAPDREFETRVLTVDAAGSAAAPARIDWTVEIALDGGVPARFGVAQYGQAFQQSLPAATRRRFPAIWLPCAADSGR